MLSNTLKEFLAEIEALEKEVARLTSEADALSQGDERREELRSKARMCLSDVLRLRADLSGGQMPLGGK